MGATSEPTRLLPGTVSFELERFERSDGRLELSGRWFGVRGMRFVRPTLILSFEDSTSSRALADLEHKPWAPLDGERWEAAFPCGEDAGVLDAELAVAPGIAIPLPAPGEALPDSDAIAAAPRDSPPRRPRGSAAARAEAAAEERDQAVSARERALAERAEALAARDKALAERDEAITERDRARAQRGPIAPRASQPLSAGVRGPILSEHHDQLIKRGLAVAVLFVAGLALLIVLGVL